MSLDPETGTIRWRIHLASDPETVFELLSTDEGRARFWAESAVEADGMIRFKFPNGLVWDGRVFEQEWPRRYVVDYFGNRVAFELTSTSDGGTDLLLIDHGGAGEDRVETHAGWVSVLMALKAATDHNIDLRNHDPARTWDDGYIDN